MNVKIQAVERPLSSGWYLSEANMLLHMCINDSFIKLQLFIETRHSLSLLKYLKEELLGHKNSMESTISSNEGFSLPQWHIVSLSNKYRKSQMCALHPLL